MDTGEIDINAGALDLRAAGDLTASTWEDVLRKASESKLTVRALRLDKNDFSGKAGTVLSDYVAKMTRLADVSVSDTSGSGLGPDVVSRLLSSLASVPAFSQPHAEVWAPIEAMPEPNAFAQGRIVNKQWQGARLCLMRNGIVDSSLQCDGDPPRLCGVLDISLSGNPLVTDVGFAALAQLVPNARRLHLGRTGIECAFNTRESAESANLLAEHWPLLDALALNGTAMHSDGFERLCKMIKSRAKNVASRKLKAESAAAGGAERAAVSAGGGAGGAATAVEKAHSYFHLDLRELPSLTPKDLSALLDDYSRFSADNTNLPWLQTEQQYFSSGQGTKAGTLILRHDFERECIVQLTITVENAPAGAAKGPFIMECDDVPQRKSLESLVTDVLQAANTKTLNIKHKYQTMETAEEEQAAEARAEDGSSKLEREVRRRLKQQNFAFATTSSSESDQWIGESLRHGISKMECGKGKRTALGRIALGGMMTLRKPIELAITLRKGGPKSGGSGAASSSERVGGGSAPKSAADYEPALSDLALPKAKQMKAGSKRKAPPAHSYEAMKALGER